MDVKVEREQERRGEAEGAAASVEQRVADDASGGYAMTMDGEILVTG